MYTYIFFVRYAPVVYNWRLTEELRKSCVWLQWRRIYNNLIVIIHESL